VDPSAAALLRKTAAKRYLAAPVGFCDDGALVLAVADPADSLGLSDIAVMTKLPVRPAVAARSQIAKLLETMTFMEEPTQGGSQAVSTVIVPPDTEDGDDGDATEARVETVPTAPVGEVGLDPGTERELSRLREELAMAIVTRDDALAKLSEHGEQAESAAARDREEAIATLKLEHERALAAREAAADEAVRAERASAQEALGALRAKHEEALQALKAKHEDELAAAQAKRQQEVEAERERTAAAIEGERERNQKELEALRARLTEELEAVRAATPSTDPSEIERLRGELAAAREQVELTADADRRAEAARAALAALRDESERQAQVHALTERELRAELEQVRGELESLRARLAEPSKQ
jgi:Type II secretion system (T2SS), protein E, N-terminal domain